ncbi:MAG: DUF2341 domain-containing protein, partial [Desulfobacterales bacterium]|nr:DUF2341 domain-containing protein [Desulfobacterales bacterium]
AILIIGPPDLISPDNDSTIYDNTPTFTWFTGANATNHRFLLDNDEAFSSPVENIQLGGTATTYTIATPLADDNYWWKVIATGGGLENSSAVWTFELMTPVAKEWYDVEIWADFASSGIPGWLTGWYYRKQQTITGSTAGAQSNYQLKIKVYYKVPPMDSFTFQSRTGDLEAHQGVASDGTYMYVTSGNDQFHLYKYRISDWELIDNRDCSGDNPTDKTQINSLFYKDGKLYIGANNWNTTPEKGWIVVYDASDLSFIEYHSVNDLWCEGCAFHDGYWWVVYCGDTTGSKIVSKYNTSWVHQADYSLTFSQTGELIGYQGIRWLGDYIYVNTHEGTTPLKCDVYEWTGSEFVETKRIDPPTSRCTQGFSFDPNDDNVIWWAERMYGGTPWDDRVLKSTINFPNDEVGLNEHCRTDFGDIRWTKNDGISLMDYWSEKIVSGKYAEFWVEIPYIPASTGTVSAYMYYGKSDATTMSNGKNTWEAFDDFTGAEIDTDLWYNEGEWSLNTADDYVYKTGTFEKFWAKSPVNCSGKRVRYKFYFGTPGNARAFGTILKGTTGTFNELYYSISTDSPYHIVYYITEWSNTDPDASPSVDTWHGGEMRISSDTVKLYINDSLADTRTYTVDGLWACRPGTTGHSALGRMTDFCVGEYADPEPIWGEWGDEESIEVPPEWTEVETWGDFLGGEVKELAEVETWTDYVESTEEWPGLSDEDVWVMFAIRILFIFGPLGFVAWKFTQVRDPTTGLQTAALIGVSFIALIILWVVADAIELMLASV